jgi:glycosyltransferase involved in cell wall biosynthesis
MAKGSAKLKNQIRLLAISNYPSETRPANQVFVRALLLELVSLGVNVTVIAPESVSNVSKPGTKFRLAPAFEVRDGLAIHRPRYFTLSNLNLPFGIRTSRLGVKAYINAVEREVEKLDEDFDICMGHFLSPHGRAAAQVGKKLGIPSVVSLGESSFDRHETAYSRREISQLLDQFSGVITNSALIKDYCIQHYGLAEEKTRVFPNGVDEGHFFPRNQKLARQQCGLPLDRPIVISVGQFIERKGPQRVLEAIKSRPEIGAVFLGYGPQEPKGPQVLFKGAVPHEEVPIWLSAADVFILPTLDEGCSNAILEALFCGLPIVSSDLPFNYSILNDKVAVLVDPLNVDELTEAVLALIDNPDRMERMKLAAHKHSESFRLRDRAKRIHQFLHQCVQAYRPEDTSVYSMTEKLFNI